MYISNEYTVLTKGDEELFIIPNKKFDSLLPGFKIHSDCYIRDMEGKIAAHLRAGQLTPELKAPLKVIEKISASKKKKLMPTEEDSNE